MGAVIPMLVTHLNKNVNIYINHIEKYNKKHFMSLYQGRR